MMKDYSISLWAFIGSIVLMSCVLIIEINTRFPVGTTAYVLIALCVLGFVRTGNFIFLSTILSTFFLSFYLVFFFFRNDEKEDLIINRVISIVIIWVAAFFALRFKKLFVAKRSESQQLQTLKDTANEGILLVNESGAITFANPAAQEIFGFAGQELINKNAGELFADSFADIISNYITNDIKNPETQRIDKNLQCKGKNGGIFSADVSFNSFNENGKSTVIIFILDTTEQKRNEKLMRAHLQDVTEVNAVLEEKVKERTSSLEHINQELIKTQMLYKAMAHNFPDGIIGIMNRNMKYVLVDGKGLTALGLNPSTVIGERLFDDIHGAITTYAEGALERVFTGENISFDLVIEGKYYNVSSVPIAINDGHINEILVVVKNVSSQKKLEKELVKTLEKEKELNTLKSRFVTMASHEFRTPLTTILSSAFLLENYTGNQL